MAVITGSSLGYAGAVTELTGMDYWNHIGASKYGVASLGSLKVSKTTGDRMLLVASGVAWGHNIQDTLETALSVQLASVASGSRWDMVVVRRDATAKSSIEVVQGSSERKLPSLKSTAASHPDQPLALCRVAAGSTTVEEIIDLRCWASAGGAEAADLLALTYLAQPGAAVKVGTDTHRYEYNPANGGSFGWKVYPAPRLVHLELDFRAPRNVGGSLWGPGSPAQMAAGVNTTASSNQDQFSFPLNNEIRVANAGVYALSWAVTGFDKPSGALITIRKDANNQILASKSIGAGSYDITAERPSIYLPAGAVIQFNFQTGEAVTCRHLLSITKLG